MEHIYTQPQFGEPWFRSEKLYSEMVQKFPDRSKFIEVGSWKGKSASFMCVEIINSNKDIEFFCVDTWQGSKEHIFSENNVNQLYQTFKSNMKPLEGFYKEIISKSTTASQYFENESLDFIFIDASHEYEDVKDDIKSWLPKLKKGGIIAGDDYGNIDFPGVHRAVIESINSYQVRDNCWIYQKN
jgi:SAM-dependent methyltransferase